MVIKNTKKYSYGPCPDRSQSTVLFKFIYILLNKKAQLVTEMTNKNKAKHAGNVEFDFCFTFFIPYDSDSVRGQVSQ